MVSNLIQKYDLLSNGPLPKLTTKFTNPQNDKTCVKCRNKKPVKEFNKNKSRKGGYSNVCRDCSKEESKKYYNKNKEKHKANVSIRNRKLEAQALVLIIEAKKEGCLLCPEKEPACLDFHHVGKKTYAVSVVMQKSGSIKKLKEEIKKCVVVCSNCHRKLHAGLLTLPSL